MPLIPGEPAPWFIGRTPSLTAFHFSSLGGRYVLLVFLPPPSPERDAALRLVHANKPLFDDVNFVVFGVLRDEESFRRARDSRVGLRWFFDPDGEIARLYDAQDESGAFTPQWVLVDPMLRLMIMVGLEHGPAVFNYLHGLGTAEEHAGVEMHAPVLIVPRVFEEALCRRLIEEYDRQGGHVSGVMREVDGMTVPMVDDFKSRRDATIEDLDLQRELRVRIVRRLLPQVERAFHYRATHMERYIVARYDAEDGGFFRAHRDNISKATAHRQFAVSINLNADEFEGGDLCFPEFGPRTYRPPTGGAVVFSCSLLHEVHRVTKGTRYAFLPFLYDEERSKIRDANAQFLVTAPALAQA